MRRYVVTLAEILHKADKATTPVPAKYHYHLVMSTELFIKLWSTRIIDFEYYNIVPDIHYQERNGIMRLSFLTLISCNDVHIKILEFMLREATGSVPVVRSEEKKNKLKQNT